MNLGRSACRLHIFTRVHELPFSGHPTSGTSHVVQESNVVAPKDGRLVQECGAGNLPLRIEASTGSERAENRRIWVEAPEAKLIGEQPELSSTLSEVLGCPSRRLLPPSATAPPGSSSDSRPSPRWR